MRKCFVIMPITTPPHLVDSYGGDDDHFQHVLECLLIPAIEEAGLQAINPSAEGNEVIQARIIQNLANHDFVLCDMTLLNPNVFFELGIRTALNKPTILVKDETTRVPFDTAIINHYTYDSSLAIWNNTTQVQLLAQHIQACVTRDETNNALWKYFGMRSVPANLEEGDDASREHVILEELQALRHDLRGAAFAMTIDGGTSNASPSELDRQRLQEIELLLKKADSVVRYAISHKNRLVSIHVRSTPTMKLCDEIQRLTELVGYEFKWRPPAG